MSVNARTPGALFILPSGTPVAAGTRVLAPAKSAVTIGSADGTEVTVEPSGSLAVVETGQTKRFALMAGAVRSHVRKLVPGERFLIDTADAEIEVHGTSFRVALMTANLRCAKRTSTRVSVTEGVVTVNWSGREDRLFPGDEWPENCAVRSGPSKRDRKAWIATGASVLASPVPAHQSSDLEEQNDLFSSAVHARHAGQTGRALKLFRQFVETYPASSLVENALVQEMRLLSSLDPPSVTDSASNYLARFPDGFARDEARALVTARTRP